MRHAICDAYCNVAVDSIEHAERVELALQVVAYRNVAADVSERHGIVVGAIERADCAELTLKTVLKDREQEEAARKQERQQTAHLRTCLVALAHTFFLPPPEPHSDAFWWRVAMKTARMQVAQLSGGSARECN